MKLSTAISKFSVQMKADGKSPHTMKSYLRDLRYFQEWLGSDPSLEDIKPDTLNEYITSDGATSVTGKSKAKNSVNHVKSSLKSFFTWAFHLGHLKENPSRCLRVKYHGRQIPNYTTPEDKQKLLGAIHEQISDPTAYRDYVLAKMYMSTGMRLHEVLSLNMQDVNLAEKKLTLHKAKGGGEVVKFLNSDLAETLTAYLEYRKSIKTNDNALFLSNRNCRISDRQVQLRFKEWFAKAELDPKLTIHSIRHGFATELFAKTKNILLVQRALDHSQIGTTQIYAHINDQELAGALELI